MAGQHPRRWRRPAGPRGQRGVILVLLLLVFVSGASLVLLSRLNEAVSRNRIDTETQRALAEAKQALIAWAASHPRAPGLLPWPDRNGDGNYDETSDCGGSLDNVAKFIGVLPAAGMPLPCKGYSEQQGRETGLAVPARDGSGNPLWYAVSRNLVRNYDPAGDPVINSEVLNQAPSVVQASWPGAATESHPWLTVRDAAGQVMRDGQGDPLQVAAVIIAPGAALSGQDRTGAADPEHYLDSVTIDAATYSNADADEDFIAAGDSDRTPAPDDAFNDALAIITVAELLAAVEERVLAEIAGALRRYRADPDRDDAGPADPDCPVPEEACDDAYPWLAPFEDPTTADYQGAAGTRAGLLPLWQPEEHELAEDSAFILEWTPAWSISGGTLSETGASPPAQTCIRLFNPPDPPGRPVSPGSQDCVPFEPMRCEWRPVDGELVELGCETESLDGVTAPDGDIRTLAVTLRFETFDFEPPAPAARRARGIDVSDTPLSARIDLQESTIVMTDDPGGVTTLQLAPDATGDMRVLVPHDLEVGDDLELPEWLVAMKWRHLLYLAYAGGDLMPGTAADADRCTPGADCLEVCVAGRDCPGDPDAPPATDDVRALVLTAGPAGAGKSRPSDDPEDYYDAENADGDAVYARRAAAAPGGDRLRIMLARPP